MVDHTANHKLNKYQKGDDDWTHSNDMQHIEHRLPIVDDESNLGDYKPHSTATFVAADTGAVFDGDGTNWNKATRDLESVGVDDLQSGKVGIDYSKAYPNRPNQEFGPGPIKTKRLQGVTSSIFSVSDVSSTNVTSPDFFADAFLFKAGGRYYLFGELMSRSSGESTIHYATATNPTGPYTSQGDLLPVVDTANSETRNFPYVWREPTEDGRVFMNHHRANDEVIDLYELTIDGTSVSATKIREPLFDPGTDMPGQPQDPMMFTWGGYWWIITCDNTNSPNEKYAFYSDKSILDTGPTEWQAHSQNPVVQHDRLGINAGREIIRGNPETGDGWIEMFCRGKDANGTTKVWSIGVEELTPTSFVWNELPTSPVVEPSKDKNAWDSNAVHHIDPVQGDYAIYDGNPGQDWEVGIAAIETGVFDEWAAVNDDHRQLLNYANQSGESVTMTTSLDIERDATYVIELLMYRDDEAGANNPLDVTFSGIADGDYAYTLVDEAMTGARSTAQNAIRLIEPTAADSIDTFSGRWYINFDGSASRVGIHGTGTDIVRGQGQTLAKGTTTTGAPNDPTDMTISATASAGESIQIHAAIWETVKRTKI